LRVAAFTAHRQIAHQLRDVLGHLRGAQAQAPFAGVQHCLQRPGLGARLPEVLLAGGDVAVAIGDQGQVIRMFDTLGNQQGRFAGQRVGEHLAAETQLRRLHARLRLADHGGPRPLGSLGKLSSWSA
jgi:hypothetical protein